MQKANKYVVDRTKRNKNIRNILLASTIVLFIAFLAFFISSFVKYRSIQTRIERIYSTVNTNQNSFLTLLTKFNDAESHFRKFSISYSEYEFNEYSKLLKELRNSVDSLKQDWEIEQILISKAKISETDLELTQTDLIQLTGTIDSLITASNNLNLLHLQNSDKKLFRLPPSPKITISESSLEKIAESAKTPSFFKRIFQPKKNDPTSKESSLNKEITTNYSKIQTESENRAQNKLDKLKIELGDLRQNERALLTKNYTLLHSTNQQIRRIHINRLKVQQEKSDKELTTLIGNTETFKWQIIISLTFVFIVICILMYYQFFTNYYEQMLVDERKYASKLAEQKTDILAEITHEIRTPINSMIGIIDLLRGREDLYGPKDIALLEAAYSNISATSKTINDILNLSKIEKHNTIESNYFDFHEMTLEIIESYRNQANSKNITLDHFLEEGKPTILFSDESKIRQIVSNLISNAIKYSSKGTVTSRLYIDHFSNLIIKVSDEGNGIPDHLKKNIFKKYYTENKTNKVEGGVGLGLFITKNIVTLLKGQISFQSKADYGTIFKVEIPVPRPKFRRKNTLNIQRIKDLPKNLSWLIVDDNALNLLYLKQFFSKHEYVYTATNGEDALNLIKQHHVDVILTDINMPVMTGDELLVNIRMEPLYSHIKIIATSSDNEQVKQREELIHIKFDEILIKPFNEKKLTETILKTLYPIYESTEVSSQD